MSGIEMLVEAAREFVAKVERGEALSVRSYKAFKEALTKIQDEQNTQAK